MFSNLNWYNVVILLLLALFIFGDKLPKVLSDALRMIRNLRRMAQNATSDLSRELGTDIQLQDLHPKTFVRKHILSEADQETLTRPLKGISDDLMAQGRNLEAEIKGVRAQAQEAADGVRGAADVRQRGGGRSGGQTLIGGSSSAPATSSSPTTSSASTTSESTSQPPAQRPQLDDIT